MICPYLGIVVFAVIGAPMILYGMALVADLLTRRWPEHDW